MDSNTCRLCALEPETFFHLLMACPRLMGARLEIFGTHVLDSLNNNFNFTPAGMLAFISNTCLDDIFGSLEAPDRNKSTASDEILSAASPTEG